MLKSLCADSKFKHYLSDAASWNALAVACFLLLPSGVQAGFGRLEQAAKKPRVVKPCQEEV